MTSDRLAFVVMPFDDEFRGIYEDLIKPPLEEVGFEVRRADSLTSHRSILQDVVVDLVAADLILLATERAFGETRANVADFALQMVGLPNFSARVTAGAHRAAAVVRRISDAIGSGEIEATRVRGILENRIPGG